MDGELGPSEALAVEEHVRACASCARARSSLQATRIALGHLPAETVSGGFDASLRARLGGDGTSRAVPKSRIAAWTALAAALLVLAVWSGRRIESERRTLPEGSTAQPMDVTALDCGLTGAPVLCRFDAPCADAGQCGRPAPINGASTPRPLVEAW
jgi:anti-sigma factor RsiW